MSSFVDALQVHLTEDFNRPTTFYSIEKEMFETLSKTQPIGRMGKPDEMGSLVLYLCSEEASFITGSDFKIDGGFVTLNT